MQVKRKWFIDFYKEEQWLSEMAQKGYELVGINRQIPFISSRMSYSFYEGAPQSRNFKLDYRVFKDEKEFASYRTLFEDSGWEHVGGTEYSGIQYFMQIDPNASDDIFSDNMSRAYRYKRYSTFWSILFLFSFAFLTTNIIFNPVFLEGFLNDGYSGLLYFMLPIVLFLGAFISYFRYRRYLKKT